MSVTLYSAKTLPATSTLGRRVLVTDFAKGEQTVVMAGPIAEPEFAAVMVVSGEPSTAITFHGMRDNEEFYITGQRLV